MALCVHVPALHGGPGKRRQEGRYRLQNLSSAHRRGLGELLSDWETYLLSIQRFYRENGGNPMTKLDPESEGGQDRRDRQDKIVQEYDVLMSQSQDEKTIVEVLCKKYALEKDQLEEIVKEVRERQGDTSGRGPPGKSNPAKPDQMGTAPPKGTAQSGKEPEGD